MIKYLNKKYNFVTPHISYTKEEEKTSLYEYALLNRPNESTIEILIFQIFYTMACIQKYDSHFAHNQLTVKTGIFITENNRTNGSNSHTCYKYNNRNFYIPWIDVSIIVGNFSKACFDDKNNDFKTIVTSLVDDLGWGYNCEMFISHNAISSFESVLLETTSILTKKRNRNIDVIYKSSDIIRVEKPIDNTSSTTSRHAWVAYPIDKKSPLCVLPEFKQFIERECKIDANLWDILEDTALNFIYVNEFMLDEDKENVKAKPIPKYEYFWNSMIFNEDPNELGLFDWAFYLAALDVTNTNILYHVHFKSLIPSSKLNYNDFVLIMKDVVLQWNWWFK